jgi:L-ascorbate metabolism protein UlaG (beta-lactamase superfamily)
VAVRVEWCYHSYVVLRAGGVTLAIDPHDGGSIGLPTCRLEADYVLVTHNHFDHNAVEVATGPRTRAVAKWRLGEFTMGPFRVRGVKVYHDKMGGKLRGWVAAYVLEVEGLRIAHLGDIGHLARPEDYPELAGVDLMFVPVGGVYTISGPEAWALVEDLKPRLVVPIHYWLPGSHLPLDPLDRFLNVARAGRRPVEGRSFEVSRGELPGKTTIVYFQPGRGEEPA